MHQKILSYGLKLYLIFFFTKFLLPMKETFTVTLLGFDPFKLVDCLDWREGVFEKKK